jgi:hypothetical protein
MLKFLHRFSPEVIGVLSGLDRIRFRGTQRLLANRGGMADYLWQRRIPWKDFACFAENMTQTMRQAIEKQVEQLHRPLIYLNSSRTRKEALALELAARDGVEQGLVAVFKCVEPCVSFTVRRDREKQKLELLCQPMKCLHYYHYYLDPRFGLMHVRTQSWFPFTVHICLNGREWLARQMDAAGIGYVKKDNCFVDIADLPAAQALFDTQLRTDWSAVLMDLAAQSNPAHAELFAACPVPYYWSAEETEWASDVMFRTPEALVALMPRLVRHGMEVLGCVDVLRFLGRREPLRYGTVGRFQGEVVTDLKRRPEGVRLLHRVNRNWVKMYDKQGTVLRVETVINDARDMKVFRSKEGDQDGPKKWLPLRKGVADLYRRTEISQKANERYLDTLAAVEETEPLGKLTQRISQPVEWKGRRARALNPLAQADAALLQAVGKGEFLLNGFRNRQLRELLATGNTAEPAETRRQTSAVTRKIRLLRAHGVIQKVTATQRYIVTEYGRTAIAALTAARNANIKLLAA